MSLIYIYNYKSTKKEEPVKLGSYELLIPPIVVNNQPWIKGYFETLCNQLVSDNEKDVDYGFWDVMERIYVNLLGQPIKREPKYWSYFGLGSYGVVAKEVFRAFFYSVDNSQQTVYFNNPKILPHKEYTYDSLYRLIESVGRELLEPQNR